MDLFKLSKIELKKKCEEFGFTKYKSKNKPDLINLINSKIENNNEIKIENNNEIKLKLKHILESSKYNHKIEILKQQDLKKAHIYCKINQLAGQILGPLIEHYIKNKYIMIKNNPSLCNGDLKYNKNNFEIKVSNGGQENNKFNYVQLRMNHNCDYILTAYYINYDNVETEGELFIFKLTKINIKSLILKYGDYAHGTKKKLGEITYDDLENPINNKEYSIRPKYGGKCWNELLHFRVQGI